MRKRAEQITRVYLYLMLTVFPLWCGCGGYRSIVDGKYPLFLLLCGGYAAAMTLLTLRTLLSPATLWRGASWTQRLIAVYLLFTWLSALLSPYFPETLVGVSRHEGALTVTFYCLCFLFVSVYGKAERGMLCALGVTVLIFCTLCICQLNGYNPLSLYPAPYNYFDGGVAYAGTYLGTIGNVDLVAAFLCLVIPIFWVTLLRKRDRRRWLLLLPLAAATYVLLRMWVLAGIVGVFGGALLALPVAATAEKRTRRRLALGVGALLVCAVLALWCFDLGGTLHEVHALLHGESDGSFGSGRLHIWRSVLREIPSHLWLGTGPDTMLRASLPPFERFDAARGVTIVAQIDVAHNEFLNILFHQGIFALLAYLGALLSAAVRCLRSHSAVTATLGTATLCWCVQALFGFSMFLTTPLFFLALALLEREL